MLRVSIRSRRGNAVLGFLGVVYAVAAAGLLIMHVSQTWGAVGLIDRGIQVMLAGTIVAGIWFVFIAMSNLGSKLPHFRGHDLHGRGRSAYDGRA